MNKIQKLTAEQKALLPVYTDKWRKIGLSTEPCNRILAEQAVKEAYLIAGLKPPEKFVWCDSPLSLVITDNLLKNKSKDSVRASVWDSVRDSVGDSVGDSVWDSVRASVYGSQDACWLGFYNFFLEVLNLNVVEKLKPLMNLAENCGWWIPRKNICILSEKPVRCNLLEGVIHSEDDPAVGYKDGFCVWAINGVKVDEQVVLHPKTQTLEQINSEENEEVKRIRIERYGWTDYLEQSGAEVLETKIIRLNSDTTWMESLMQLNDIKVLCTYDPSTGRLYVLEVDPRCKTCQDAQYYLQAPEEAFSGFSFKPTETYPVLRT